MSEAPSQQGAQQNMESITIGGHQQPVSRATDYKSCYAANFRFRITNIDAAVTFVSVGDFPGGVTTLQDEATVMMTFSSLKILSEHLAMAVSALEQELGPIRIPTSIRPTEQNKAMMIQAIKATPLSE